MVEQAAKLFKESIRGQSRKRSAATAPQSPQKRQRSRREDQPLY